MRIDPALRALRADERPQREAQLAAHEAMADWRERPEIAGVLGDFIRFAEGEPIAGCPVLASLFAPGGEAGPDFVGSLVSEAVAILKRAPLAHLPQRHFSDRTLATLLLARKAGATLSLAAIDGEAMDARPPATTAAFWPGEAFERVLAGRGEAEIAQAPRGGGGPLDRRTIALHAGVAIARDAEREALVPRRVDGCLVSLRLQRRRNGAGPSREYSLHDGALLHQAAGDPRDSRAELAIAMLARMGRTDAAPAIAAVTREPGSDGLRWQALRECLALDTLTGFQALSSIAADAADLLAAPAGALRVRLVEAYPQLAGIQACPAS